MVLSSVHQAKGLEWRAVFLVWLADGRFPSAQALRDRDGEEEERRLFYVACTRARDELFLCFPLVEAPRDRERVVLKASRFVEELPGDPVIYERWQLDEPAAPPALPGGAPRAGLPPSPAAARMAALEMPRLFGEPGDGEGDGGPGGGEEPGGNGVPF